jgi:hypothetical protein
MFKVKGQQGTADRRAKQNEELAQFNTDRSYQYLPNQKRDQMVRPSHCVRVNVWFVVANFGMMIDHHLFSDIQYISRMECMQAAVQIQIETLKKKRPDAKVALITFATEVTIIGDGSHTGSTIVAGDKLNDLEKLMAVADKLDVSKLKAIKISEEALSNHLFSLSEGMHS